MKTNVTILREIGKLGAIRQRLGAVDENDDIRDEHINTLTATDITRAWCGWKLGDEGWADSIINLYERVKSASK